MTLYTNSLDGYSTTFSCRLRKGHHFLRWQGQLRFLSTTLFPYTFAVSSGGREYLVFIDQYINGLYISIPSMFTAADIAPFDDFVYNKNKLLEAGMEEFWAVTIAQALRVFDLEMRQASELRKKAMGNAIPECAEDLELPSMKQSATQ